MGSRSGLLEASWRSLASLLGALGSLLGALGSLLGALGGLLGRVGSLVGHQDSPERPILEFWGRSWDLLERSWEPLGALLASLGGLLAPSWEHFGAIF